MYTQFLPTLRKHMTQDKLWTVLWVYGVESHLLLAEKLLQSCSEVCVRVAGVKSKPFTIGVGL